MGFKHTYIYIFLLHSGVYTDCVLSFTGAECDLLRRECRQTQQSAFAKGTRENIGTHWRSFIMFCLYFELVFLPASLDTVCVYVQFLSRSFCSMTSVRNYLHGVKLLHLFAGVMFPCAESFELKLLLRGLDRVHPHAPRQALAITPNVLLKIYKFVNLNDPLHVACWSAYLIAFFLMLRKSNLVPTSWNKFVLKKQLSRGDILVCDAGLLVNMYWSKTNQFGHRILRIPVASIPSCNLCPLTAYRRLLSIMTVQDNMPAFTYRPRNCVTSYKFIRVLRQLLTKAGFQADCFTGHSFRRGGASFAFQAGVPGEMIKLIGDWKSNAYLGYLDFSFESKFAVGVSMRNKIIKDMAE